MKPKRKRARELVQELTSNPFFPLLFVGKSAETSAYWLVGSASDGVVFMSYLMAAVSIVAWLYTYDEVRWGICKVEEAADNVAETIEEEE